jgi:hypothetical protein
MEELKRTSTIVLKILKEDVSARKDDNYLIKRVHDTVIPGASEMTLNQVLGLITRKELPCFESIRRSRQKIQEHHPELCGTDEVEGQRVLNEERVREYARSVNV